RPPSSGSSARRRACAAPTLPTTMPARWPTTPQNVAAPDLCPVPAPPLHRLRVVTSKQAVPFRSTRAILPVHEVETASRRRAVPSGQGAQKSASPHIGDGGTTMTDRARVLRRVVLIPLLTVALVATGGGLFLLTRHAPSVQAAQQIDASYANGQTV